jgi:serine/threonine protein kinase
MGLSKGQVLRDEHTADERFRIGDLLAEGRSFFIAEGQDTHLDEMTVVLKAIRYSDSPSESEVSERAEALQLELEALTQPSSLLPEPIDFIHVKSDLGFGATEPVLVLEYVSGRTLREEVKRAGGGLNPKRAVNLVHEIALTIADLNEAGFIFRDLDPDHIVVGFDDVVHMVGTGNIARAQSRPLLAKMDISPRYSAPEIRQERSGKFLVSRADVYSLGALLSYLLTGSEPTEQIEGPLGADAHAKLLTLPEGYRLLVARSLQPMAKQRFASVRAMVEHLDVRALPTRATRGFSKAELPLPFDRSLPDNRATRSRLSSGPLVSQPREAAQKETTVPVKREQPVDWWRGCLPWAACVVFGFAGLAYSIL